MSFEKAPLQKLLKLFYSPPKLRVSFIRDEIRSDRDKAAGRSGNGGDFHVPFWADAKRHVVGEADLRVLVVDRVARDKRKERLYPLLVKGFLGWWDEKRRWRNEPLVLLPTPLGTQLVMPEVPGVAKIGGAMRLESGPDFHRIIYPYFAEAPSLPDEAARLGLWAMSAALGHHDTSDLRILDVLRGNSFAVADVPFDGQEHELFVGKYRKLMEDYETLKREY